MSTGFSNLHDAVQTAKKRADRMVDAGRTMIATVGLAERQNVQLPLAVKTRVEGAVLELKQARGAAENLMRLIKELSDVFATATARCVRVDAEIRRYTNE